MRVSAFRKSKKMTGKKNSWSVIFLRSVNRNRRADRFVKFGVRLVGNQSREFV